MASAAENTKIEQITEAFEQLAISIAQGMILAEKIQTFSHHLTPEIVAVQRADARKEVAASLRELLKPTLRLVAPEREPYPKHRTLGDQMMGCGND